MILFWTFILLGCGASGVYRKLTPNMSVVAVHFSFRTPNIHFLQVRGADALLLWIPRSRIGLQSYGD